LNFGVSAQLSTTRVSLAEFLSFRPELKPKGAEAEGLTSKLMTNHI
jgi:hypothetical protein